MAKQLLTNVFCKTAEHTGNNANTNYFDTELTGFMLEARKNGANLCELISLTIDNIAILSYIDIYNELICLRN